MSVVDVLSGVQSWHIEQADALEGLRSLPDDCVQCCVTSPPYWGLRNYGIDGQLGLEPTPGEYIAGMTAVFLELQRVLRVDGTLWLNMGDCYAGSGKGQNADGTPNAGASKQGTNRGTMTGGLPKFTGVSKKSTLRMDGRKHQGPYPEEKRLQPIMGGGSSVRGVPPKSLLGMPWRLAFALQDAGWLLRAEIIWAKPAPMPESVTDRPTRAHEQIFLFANSSRYFYDAAAIREQQVSDHPSGNGFKRPERLSYGRGFGARGSDDEWFPSDTGRNARTVWTIGPEPFSEAHFATFPTELPRRCIAAGTSEHGCCPTCGAPWRRCVDYKPMPLEIKAQFEAARKRSADDQGRTDGFTTRKPNYTREVIGETWAPACECLAGDPVPCVVLDPFVGSGTTVMVARRLGRRGIGLELSPTYAEMARRRVSEDQPMFNRQEATCTEAEQAELAL